DRADGARHADTHHEHPEREPAGHGHIADAGGAARQGRRRRASGSLCVPEKLVKLARGCAPAIECLEDRRVPSTLIGRTNASRERQRPENRSASAWVLRSLTLPARQLVPCPEPCLKLPDDLLRPRPVH